MAVIHPSHGYAILYPDGWINPHRISSNRWDLWHEWLLVMDGKYEDYVKDAKYYLDQYRKAACRRAGRNDDDVRSDHARLKANADATAVIVKREKSRLIRKFRRDGYRSVPVSVSIR